MKLKKKFEFTSAAKLREDFDRQESYLGIFILAVVIRFILRVFTLAKPEIIEFMGLVNIVLGTLWMMSFINLIKRIIKNFILLMEE